MIMMPRKSNLYWERASKIRPDRDEEFDMTGEEGAYGDRREIPAEGSDPEKILLDRELEKEERKDREDDGDAEDEKDSPRDEKIDEEEGGNEDIWEDEGEEDKARGDESVYGEGLDEEGQPIDRPLEAAQGGEINSPHPSHSGFSSRERAAAIEYKSNRISRTHQPKRGRPKGGDTIRKEV
ncbi:hypothetical protein A3H10_00645 [Candidatus Uhrbacteria bacterium RIFCSPLOWO2_12_FULL_46_10]|nr:MAG: hypothetical protein A3H10_00645 [Candidatus Uhrbacteria bacterium RIFCSPLOWO2_12_FULL_46_10]